MKYLIDASSLLLLIKKTDIKSTIQVLQDSAILDLTFYETGNAVWKETTLKYLTQKESEKLGTLAQSVISKIKQTDHTPEDFPKILQIAQTEKLTYYDSSYVHFAKKAGLILITEDKELAIKATNYVAALKVKDLQLP
jgi:predicted nucleic acid-binding protein